jgi:hypothetical protein
MQADGNPIDALPEDPAILRALLLSAWSERDRIVGERNELAEQNERLQHLVLKLKRLKFGAKSERLPEDQLQLALGDVETAIAQLEAQGEKRDPERRREGIAKRRASRGALPADLPRGSDADAERYQLSLLPGGDDRDWSRRIPAARHHPGTVPGDRNAAAEICLPGL